MVCRSAATGRPSILRVRVGEANEGQVVAGERLRNREGLLRRRVVLVNVVKVARVLLGDEVGHHGRHCLPYVRPRPRVVFEERVLFDLVGSVAAQTLAPFNFELFDFK